LEYIPPYPAGRTHVMVELVDQQQSGFGHRLSFLLASLGGIINQKANGHEALKSKKPLNLLSRKAIEE
jgi:hypothetical protein